MDVAIEPPMDGFTASPEVRYYTPLAPTQNSKLDPNVVTNNHFVVMTAFASSSKYPGNPGIVDRFIS